MNPPYNKELLMRKNTNAARLIARTEEMIDGLKIGLAPDNVSYFWVYKDLDSRCFFPDATHFHNVFETILNFTSYICEEYDNNKHKLSAHHELPTA